jgi:hypothetical protein
MRPKDPCGLKSKDRRGRCDGLRISARSRRGRAAGDYYRLKFFLPDFEPLKAPRGAFLFAWRNQAGGK